MPKAHASFFYFILESKDGLCFYSTTDDSLKEAFRDVEIYHTPEMENEMLLTLDSFISNYQLEVLKQEIR